MTRAAVDANAQTIVADLLAAPPLGRRRLIAIAGPPAAGKSTVAARVQALMIQAGHPTGLVPMDGFHLDNDTLRDRGLLSRKGAPETFDLAGFTALVDRLMSEATVPVPLFDRENDCTLPDASRVTADQTDVVLEGNYLLFDAPGWRDLAQHWDYAAFIDEDLNELTRRLQRRWTGHGLDAAAAAARAEANDLPNAKRVLQNRLPSTRTLPGCA